MQRRQFSLGLLAGLSGLTGLASLPAFAVETAPLTPEEGVNFELIKPAVSTDTSNGKILVLDFFAYTCGFCSRFSPQILAWASKQDPSLIDFRSVPVSFREIVEPHARLYYTLEMLNRLDLHNAAFDAILVQRKKLITANEASEFFTTNGVDAKEAMNVYNSFGTHAKVQQANATWRAHGVEATPAVSVAGQYRLVGGDAKNIILLDQLIEKVKNSR